MREINDQTLQLAAQKAVIIRENIIKMLAESGSGHPGGSLSAADIMACLYFWEMNIDPGKPLAPERDRFVLSKGHAAPVLYATLAEKGFFPAEDLLSLRQLGSPLQGHPDMRKLAGVEASTGSLGQGISWAVGMALAGKMDQAGYRVYTLLGDGELEEGMVWEAVMAAAHYHLDNLTAIVDNNGLQIDGQVQKIMNVAPIGEKFAAFNWEVIAIDGHDLQQIMTALEKARGIKDRPTAIIAQTIKGKGVSFMEDRAEWHGKAPKKEEAQKALEQIKAEAAALGIN
ncbi:MAG: transketolase [Syntrophomonadaceae bacterium]|nr:transketolase [Syntrophomonadaceae bacterium]